jgi:hypothetical protein
MTKTTWSFGVLKFLGIIGDPHDEEEAAHAAEERRRKFGKLYDGQGHHGAVGSSTVCLPPMSHASVSCSCGRTLIMLSRHHVEPVMPALCL